MLKEHQALRAQGRAQFACICLCMFIWSAQTQALEPLQAPDESADRAQAMRQLRVLVETAEPAVATQAADLLQILNFFYCFYRMVYSFAMCQSRCIYTVSHRVQCQV